MSWQGDQEQPPSAGRGRRRRDDSAAEEQYAEQQYAEQPYTERQYEEPQYAQPQYGEPQAAEQDIDYAPYQGYGYTQAQSEYTQPGYTDSGYSEASYGDTQYGSQGYSTQGYSGTDYGYTQPQVPNLNSSGFYQVAEPVSPAADPYTPQEPAYQQPSVPQQPYWQQAPEPPAAPVAPAAQAAPTVPAPAPAPPARPDPRVVESHVISSHVISSHVIESRTGEAQAAAESRNVADRFATVTPAAPVEPAPSEPAATPAEAVPTAPAAEAVPTAPVGKAAAAAAPSEKPNVRGIDEDIRGFLSFVESRADSRQERARRLRFRLIVLGVLVVVAGGATGLWALLTGGSGGPKSTQTTVLLQIRDASENAIGSAVLVADKSAVEGKPTPTGTGAAMVIPAELSVQNAALESQPFGGAMPQTPPAGKDALSDLLGVDVDGVWTVDELTFAAFLSNLGGVYVDVDVPVTGPSGQVLIPAGKHQQLDGTKAVAFAAFHAQDEAPAAELARFSQVVNGMLARIPTDPKLTATLLNSLAAVPDPALPNDRLAAILSALGAEKQGGHYQMQTLPVRQDGSGLLDLDAASKVVAQLLPGAVHSRDDGGLTRVAVTDATGRLDVVSSSSMAGSKLLNGGYTPLMLGPVQSTPTSYVEVPNAGGQTLGKQIAETLGLADSAVKVAPFDTTLVDARVVLGQDWTAIGQVPTDVSTSDLANLLSPDGATDPAAPPDGGASSGPSSPASSSKSSAPGTRETTPQGKTSGAKG